MDKMPRALCLLQSLDLDRNMRWFSFVIYDLRSDRMYLVFQMLVLSFQVLNVAAVAAVLPPHEGNVFTGLSDIVTATTSETYN